MAYDVSIKNGLIVGGSGIAAFRGDIAVKDEDRRDRQARRTCKPRHQRRWTRCGVLLPPCAASRVRYKPCRGVTAASGPGAAGSILQERDHRNVKRLIRSDLGFGSFWTARRILAGYEAMAMIRKGPVRNIGGSDIRAQARFIATLFEVAA